MNDWIQVLLAVIAVALAVAWYLSYTAARLDRLHAKTEGALSALDAQLVRRAEAAMELAASGAIDPASSMLLAEAASASLERHTEHPITDDPLDGQNFAGREDIESDLTGALTAALQPDVVASVRRDPQSLGGDALDRLEAAGLRVQLARRFHNDAVREVRRVRAKRVVRAFRLAGHAALPDHLDFDDGYPHNAT